VVNTLVQITKRKEQKDKSIKWTIEFDTPVPKEPETPQLKDELDKLNEKF
jgi:hypothetical protein